MISDGTFSGKHARFISIGQHKSLLVLSVTAAGPGQVKQGIADYAPAEERAVKQGANAAHQQLMLHRHSSKVDSLVSGPYGNFGPHGGQEVLLQLLLHLLCCNMPQGWWQHFITFALTPCSA